MEKTNFREGFSALWHGIAEIGTSSWICMKHHVLLILLIMSCVANVYLMFSVGMARAERDNRDSVACQIEQKMDSINRRMGYVE